ncbi:Uncharacterized membrane protein YckC, RDD family [Alteromonadaceae bacterium Bs31]|nr:Uncharacterized membrane protein YckC, RDD family [Alteromonadaceae bacterium Bs31]
MEDNNVYTPPKSELEAPNTVDELASRWARLWGALIDGVIGFTVMIPLMFITGYWERAMAQTVGVTETVLYAVFGFVIFAVLHGYFLVKNGQTIGKKILGTKIVSNETGEVLPVWKVLFLRYLPVSVAANIPVLGGFVILINYLFVFSKSKRCLHDLIASTKVINVDAH